MIETYRLPLLFVMAFKTVAIELSFVNVVVAGQALFLRELRKEEL